MGVGGGAKEPSSSQPIGSLVASLCTSRKPRQKQPTRSLSELEQAEAGVRRRRAAVRRAVAEGKGGILRQDGGLPIGASAASRCPPFAFSGAPELPA